MGTQADELCLFLKYAPDLPTRSSYLSSIFYCQIWFIGHMLKSTDSNTTTILTCRRLHLKLQLQMKDTGIEELTQKVHGPTLISKYNDSQCRALVETLEDGCCWFTKCTSIQEYVTTVFLFFLFHRLYHGPRRRSKSGLAAYKYGSRPHCEVRRVGRRVRASPRGSSVTHL